MATKSKLMSRVQLQLIYDMACEMSYSNSYAEVTEAGDVLGRDPNVTDALNAVRKFFRLKGSLER